MSNPPTSVFINYATRSLLLPALAVDASRQSDNSNNESSEGEIEEIFEHEINSVRESGVLTSSWQEISLDRFSSNYYRRSLPSTPQQQSSLSTYFLPFQGLGSGIISNLSRRSSTLDNSMSIQSSGVTNSLSRFSLDDDDSDLSSQSPIAVQDDSVSIQSRSSTNSNENIGASTYKRVGKHLLNDSKELNLLDQYKCSVCVDTIVGAAVLDCSPYWGHTFCSRCIQQYIEILGENRKCPYCNCSFTKAVPCPDLDIAISYVVNHACNAGEISEEFVNEYNARLVEWKNHIREMNTRKEARNRSWFDVRHGFSRIFDYFGTVQIGAWASAAALSILFIALGTSRRN